MSDKKLKWSDENVASLLSIVGDTGEVSVEAIEEAAKALGATTRAVASKLRSMKRDVASMAKEKVPAFTEAEGAELAAFVSANAGQLTYREIAEQFAEGKFNHKQVQGKILALELTSSVKPAEKVETVRSYTEQEEAKFVQLVAEGAYIEDISRTLSKSIPSVRGKALSLLRAGQIEKIPAQKESHAKESGDPVESLGENIVSMTVEEIAKAVNKTERGIRTLLTRRGIKVANYDGAAKKEKAEGKKAA